MKKLILTVIDFFYPIVRRLMPLQTFRYAACGGSNTVFDIILFHLLEENFKQHGIIRYGSFAISPHIAALIAAFCLSFPTGFYLSRYVVFTESNVRGRVQLIRYFSLVLACIALNYMFLKFFIEQLHFEATFSKIITSIFVVTFSYLSQKHFTFKIKKIEHRSGQL